MKKVENLHINLKWPLLDIEEETDSGEWLETQKRPYPIVIEEPMGSREIIEGHKVISRAIAPGADTVIETNSREMGQVLEVEVDLTKVQMLAHQGSLVKLFQEMPQDIIIARNQATYCNSVTDVKKMNVD